MPSCFVANCKNSTRKRIPGITFHKIPTKYSQQWLSAIKRPADTYLPHKTVCSAHFSANDFYHNYYGERKRLKDGAIPSIGTMKSINETSMESESMDPLTVDTDSTRLPEQCKPREEAVALKSSASTENRAVTLKKDDLGKICRCCLSHETIGNIFYLKYDETLFVDMIFKLLETQVNPGDGLPLSICGACVAALINFYNFKKIYNNSLATLLSVLRENEENNFQQMEDDNNTANEDFKEEMPDINISENELYEESKNDSTETQKPESTISEDQNKILANNEELCMVTSDESYNIPQLKDNISGDEIDEEFQYKSKEKENINNIDNNESTAVIVSPKRQKQNFTLPRFCKSFTKEHECSTNTKRLNESLQVHYRIHKPSLLVNQSSDDEKGVTNPITDPRRQEKVITCSCGVEFQYKSNEKENINGVGNNKSTPFLFPKQSSTIFTLPRFCQSCKTWIVTKGHECSTNMKRGLERGSFVCEFCGKSFLYNATLQGHYRIHKPSLPVKQISAEKRVMKPNTDTRRHDRDRITCLCGLIFRSSSSLARHKTEKNHLDPLLDTKCEFCNKVVTKRGLNNHIAIAHSSQELRVIDCSTCGKIFENRSQLVQHVRVHGEKKFLCAYCGKRFLKATAFKTHCRGHTGEKPFICNICGQKFRSSRNLSQHMNIHTGRKSYVCKFCSKGFVQMQQLRIHLRIHTGEKPFNCPYCDKTFAHRTTKVVHIRTHTGEKPYTCDTCGKSFITKAPMMAHRRIHTGEKPYLCDHCGETFSTRNAYRNHLAVKHQEKINSNFQCEICNKSYSSKQFLKKHVLKKH